jgi:hypothetical protein
VFLTSTNDFLKGAVGIEIAAELKLIEPSLKVTLVHSRDNLLSSEPLPDEFKDRALSVLKDAKVEVVLNHRVVDISPVEGSGSNYKLTLGDGSQMAAGAVITALSKPVPTTSYLPDLALDLDGYVKISSRFAALPIFDLDGANISQYEFCRWRPEFQTTFCHRRSGCVARYQAMRRHDAYGPHCGNQYPSTDPS